MKNPEPFSRADCERDLVKETCTGSADGCGYVHMNYKEKNGTTEFTIKGCVEYEKCIRGLSKVCTEMRLNGEECHYSCCRVDLCNGAMAVHVDFTLLCFTVSIILAVINWK